MKFNVILILLLNFKYEALLSTAQTVLHIAKYEKIIKESIYLCFMIMMVIQECGKKRVGGLVFFSSHLGNTKTWSTEGVVA